ncbi:hypothetical protein DT075_37810 [Bacillus licheniformis]|nr:hypothetical protein DT075_37810 [Bacillus licheniformis]
MHTGDNRTGEGEGDDEQVKINLNAVPADIQKISFVITIHEAEARRQNFGQVSNAYVRVMAISLAKGQKIDLTKTNPGLSKVVVGLGWDVNQYDGGADFDLDASVFLLNAEGKCSSEKDFIFYNQ